MRRTMGMLLVLLADLFRRPKPRYQERFERILGKHGSQVSVLVATTEGVDEFVYDPEISTTALVENLAIEEEIVKSGQFTTEDIRGYFRAFTPIAQHDRLEWRGMTYQIETVKNQHHIDRILWAEILARKVAE